MLGISETRLSNRVRIGSFESLKRTCSKERFFRESDITKSQSELSSSLQQQDWRKQRNHAAAEHSPPAHLSMW